MKGLCGAGVASLALLDAACSSTTTASPRHNSRTSITTPDAVSVADVQAAMFRAGTARIRGFPKGGGLPPGVNATFSGAARFGPEEAYDVRGETAGKWMIEQVVLGQVVFTKGTLVGVRVGWCRSTHGPASHDYSAMTLNDVLFSVKPSDATPVRVGNEMVDSTSTTHYRLSPPKTPTVDYWLDDMNRVVRSAWVSDPDSSEYDTFEFYDFGASIPPITAPPHAPSC